MDLVTLWFVIVAFLWIGFFFLEGFDFGVGVLTWLGGGSETEKRQLLATIGPLWDADEVWLVTGGISLFAAFPLWYATVFPAAYIPLLLVIAAIIVRGVAVEYRNRRMDTQWHRVWDVLLGLSSLLLPLLFGVFWAGMVHGIPLAANGEFVGQSLWSFINIYSLLGGLTLLGFALSHGASFAAIKTENPVRARMSRLATWLSGITAVLMAVFAVLTFRSYTAGDAGALTVGAIAGLSMFMAVVAHLRGHHKLAFWINGLAVVGFVAQMFIGLYPNALPSTLNPADSLTLTQAAASSASLTLITWFAAVGLPLVIVYQAWSFWVFRKRISVAQVAGEK